MEKKSFTLVDCIKKIDPYIVRIETPDGWGTGFLVARGKTPSGNVVAIGTAKHVTGRAFKWHKPIKIIYPFKNENAFLTFGEYKYMEDNKNDLSFIELRSETFSFPEELITLVNPKVNVLPGVKIGWCGFPGNLPEPVNLCYFSGHVSSIFGEGGDYLIDGTAINGISGGPAFLIKENPPLMGVVSQYIPNVQGNQALPGLSFISNIRPMVAFFEKSKKKEQQKNEDSTN